MASGPTTLTPSGVHGHIGAWTADSTAWNGAARFCVASPLWSESLGLSGRADVVEVDGDAVRPVEYKSGVRHGITADLQLCAQALCLEEMLGVAVPSGSVWYGGPRRHVEIEFTGRLRNQVLVAIDAIRGQLLTGELPEAANDERCNECQLLHHCLPGVTNAKRRVQRYLTGVVFGCDT